MAATRVRLLPEHRNGNLNYLRFKRGGEWVPCSGDNELHALCVSFFVMCDELSFKPEEVRKELQRVMGEKPSHD